MSSFGQNYFLWVIDYKVLLTQVGQLIQHTFGSIICYINFNLDMTFQIKILEDWSFNEHLF